jgi:hypothetical protein
MHAVILLIALLPALFLSQLPEFVQQYSQRMGGAIDELTRIVEHFDEDSRRSGYDRSSALQLMAKNPEQLIREQSTRMQDNFARLNRLRAQQQAFNNSTSVGRSFEFLKHYDPPLAERTFASFRFGLSIDGVVLGALGWFLGSLLMFCLFAVGRRSHAAA